MSIVRVTNPDQIRPSHVVLIGLVYVVLLGSCLITCGSKMATIPDGAVAWKADSMLRAVVELLNLGNSQPTLHGVAIKSFIFAMGAAVAAVVLGIAVAARSRRGDEVTEDDTVVEEVSERDETLAVQPITRRSISPLAAAQVLALAYVAWSFLSVIWSAARDFAWGGSVLLGIGFLWTFALGLGLNRVAGRKAAYGLVIAGVATAVIAILYKLERNPTLRASHPIGNPIFLATCLIPGLIVALCGAGSSVAKGLSRRRYRWLGIGLAGGVALATMGWAFALADSRGPTLGLALACVAIVFFRLRRTGKIVVATLALVGVIGAGATAMVYRDTIFSPGRSATLRLRLLAGTYAIELGSHHKPNGYGQAGFVLNGDALAVRDVLDDPEALEYPIRHAHNEFLEVWADLGAIGVVLFAGSLVLTLWAAIAALPTLPSRSLRWMLIALSASLVGIVAAEQFSVGLRFPGVPTIFFTVWGLIWAMSSQARTDRRTVLEGTGRRRVLVLVVAAVLGVGTATLARRDFAAARSLYQVAESLDQLEWDRALSQVDDAYRNRLNPQRKLAALDVRCAARLHIAQYFQASAMRRFDAARELELSDDTQAAHPSHLMALANQDVGRAREMVSQGLAIVHEMGRKAPHCWNAGWLEFGLRQVQVDFAVFARDKRLAEQHAETARAALERELQRRPFDPRIASQYVRHLQYLQELGIVTAPPPVDDVFDLLARPLRFHGAPSTYPEILGHLAESDGFEEAFEAMLRKSRQALEVARVEDWEAPFAPERLRLAALTPLDHFDFAAVTEWLEEAVTLYHRLGRRGLVGLATAYAELADARFFANPDDPQPAIEAAESAVKTAPGSERGRELIAIVHERLIAYHLAAGHEDFVLSNLLPRIVRSRQPEPLRRELSRRYSMLCRSFILAGGDRLPDGLRRWADRALELDSTNPTAWLLRAQLAYTDGDDHDCAASLTEALRRGADPQAVALFLQSVVQERPDSEPLRRLLFQVSQQLGVPISAPATQPAGTTVTQPAEALRPTTAPADVSSNGR